MLFSKLLIFIELLEFQLFQRKKEISLLATTNREAFREQISLLNTKERKFFYLFINKKKKNNVGRGPSRERCVLSSYDLGVNLPQYVINLDNCKVVLPSIDVSCRNNN